jgi:hypothetical protein
MQDCLYHDIAMLYYTVDDLSEDEKYDGRYAFSHGEGLTFVVMQAFGSMSDRRNNGMVDRAISISQSTCEKKTTMITPSVAVELCANNQRAATQTRFLHEMQVN